MFKQWVKQIFTSTGDQTISENGLEEDLVSQTLEACSYARDNQLYRAAVQPAMIANDLTEVYVLLFYLKKIQSND